MVRPVSIFAGKGREGECGWRGREGGEEIESDQAKLSPRWLASDMSENSARGSRLLNFAKVFGVGSSGW